jgi:hypothetical protein
MGTWRQPTAVIHRFDGHFFRLSERTQNVTFISFSLKRIGLRVQKGGLLASASSGAPERQLLATHLVSVFFSVLFVTAELFVKTTII